MKSDEEPIGPAGGPSPSEIEALLGEPLNALHKVLKRRGVQPADAWDIVQETMIFAYRNYDKHDPTKRLSAWVVGIGLNKLRDFRKSQRLRWGLPRLFRRSDKEPLLERDVKRQWALPPKETPEQALLSKRDLRADPLERLLRAEAAERLDHALAQLSEECANALILHHVLGFQQAEIAEMTHAKVSTVAMRIQRGLAALRKLLTYEDVEDLL